MNKKINPAQEEELRFLRRQVDQRELSRFDHINIKYDYSRAREELKQFVLKLRREGKNI
jgi:hypothetical protein